MKIEGPIPQDEATAAMFQALGMLLSEFQKARGSDHLSYDHMGFTWKVGVRDEGLIDLEKHELEEHAPSPPPTPKKGDAPKIVSLEEFQNGL